MIVIHDFIAVKSTSKKTDEIKPAVPATVHIKISTRPTMKLTTIIPSNGEITKIHAEFNKRSVFGFIVYLK